jgi:hypothetical protein
VPVAVTFCPLCNTAIVFDRRVGGKTLDFGVSGNLRNSDLIMYDRQTESWWQDDRRLAPKERVVFLERGRYAVVIPFSTLAGTASR